VGSFGTFFAQHAVAAAFLFSFLENAGLPIPVFPVLVLAGAWASTRHALLGMVVAAAVLGALLADVSWYFAGRWRGKRVLSGLCRMSFNPDACLERAVDGFHRRKVAAVLFAKFLPGVNTITPPLAGVAHMPFPAFAALDLAGAILWAGSAAVLGFAFGEEIAGSAKGVQGAMGWILAGGIVATVAWRVAYRFLLVRKFSAPRVSPEELHERMTGEAPPMVLDLRRDDDFSGSDRMIAGALRVRPASFHRYAHHLPRDRELVFYCT
jgi:membrane protein DedA with SNARE-associated domain